MTDTPIPTVYNVLQARNITRVRHFTTDRGLLGILSTGELRCRDQLSSDDYLEHIYLPNCATRRDGKWTGYVSLSITDINAQFFAICSGSPSWHKGMDGHWVILEFAADILTHEGVVFVTTNNMYSGAERGTGASGLEALFADVVYPYKPRSQSPKLHRTSRPQNMPTDPQAEALYPGHIDTSHLSRIIVADDNHASNSTAMLYTFRALNPSISVTVEPDAFRPFAGDLVIES